MAKLRRSDVAILEVPDDAGGRAELVEFLEDTHQSLTELADAVAAQRFRHPAPMQQLDRPLHLPVAGRWRRDDGGPGAPLRDRAPHHLHLLRRRQRQLRPRLPAARVTCPGSAASATGSSPGRPPRTPRRPDVYGNADFFFHVTSAHRTLEVISRSLVEVRPPATDAAGLGMPWERARPQHAGEGDAVDFVVDLAADRRHRRGPRVRRAVVPARPRDRGRRRGSDPPDLRRLHLPVRVDHGHHPGRRRPGRPGRGSARTSRTSRWPACARSGWPAGTCPATWPPTRRPGRPG